MEPKKLHQLLEAARAVSPDCEVRFKGTEREDEWVCLVAIGGATIFESKSGPTDDILDLATTKMKGMSKRMLAALDPEVPGVSKKS
jgi:hypothetical protein